VTSLADVVRFLDTELRTSEVPDYDAAKNGLQLANAGSVTKVAAAVDYSVQTVAGALASGADLLLVHHGMFWPGAEPVVGAAYERLKAAISGGLAVYSSHLPLDLHPTLGNNALLARELGLAPSETFGDYKGMDIGVMGAGDVETATIFERLRSFSERFRTTAVATSLAAGRRTRRWAVITGAGANSESIAECADRGVDTLIVGEGAHHTAVSAMERGLVILYGGHYATETLGVKALADHVASRFGLAATFVDFPTGL